MKKEDEYTLDRIKPGDTVRITGTRADAGMRRRLRDVGFCDGEALKCILVSPLGDPAAYLVRGTLIALRREVSSLITVTK